MLPKSCTAMAAEDFRLVLAPAAGCGQSSKTEQGPSNANFGCIRTSCRLSRTVREGPTAKRQSGFVAACSDAQPFRCRKSEAICAIAVQRQAVCLSAAALRARGVRWQAADKAREFKTPRSTSPGFLSAGQVAEASCSSSRSSRPSRCQEPRSSSCRRPLLQPHCS